MKRTFTMVELVFVIVVLGILAAIAIPKFSVTRDDANIVKGKSTVASIQSGLVTERTKRIMRGEAKYPATLDSAANNTEGEQLFTEVLEYPVRAKHSAGGWKKTGSTKYQFYINNSTTVEFTYNAASGRFECDSTDSNCKRYFLN